MKSNAGLLVLLLGCGWPALRSDAQTVPAADFGVSHVNNGVRIISDVPYEGVADHNRELNIYLPQNPPATTLPLIVMIHGGGWSAGDKNDFGGVAEEFVERGYAAASINYRLSQQAIFPAQIVDCKAAIRWLRAHAQDFGFDPTRVVVGGHSAGGHLAALVGVTSSVKAFDIGANRSQSSGVQAVLWFAGVSNLISRTLVPGYEGEQDPHSGESMLVGGPVLQRISMANQASPLTYVNRNSAPFVLFHGDVDKTVPVEQAIEMYTALLRAGVPAELHIIPGADHGGPGYFTPLMFDQIDAFLDKTLKRTSLGALNPPLQDGAYTLIPVSAPHLALEARGDSQRVELGILKPDAPSQTWMFQARGAGRYAIHPSDNPSLSLTVTPGSTADTTKVILMPDQEQPTQQWTIHGEVDGKFLLTPQIAVGSALDDLGGATTPGSSVDIFTSGGYDPHLQWRIMPMPTRADAQLH